MIADVCVHAESNLAPSITEHDVIGLASCLFIHYFLRQSQSCEDKNTEQPERNIFSHK